MFREYGGDAKILIGANALGQLFLQFSIFIMPFYLRALGYDMSSMGIFKRRSWGKLRHHAFSISFGLGTIFMRGFGNYTGFLSSISLSYPFYTI